MGDAIIGRLRSGRRTWLMLFDASAILGSYVVYAFLRYGLALDAGVLTDALLLGALAIAIQLLIGSVVRVYQGRATVASLEETVLLSVVTSAAGLIVSTVNVLPGPILIARSVPPGATFMALVGMVLGRAIWRSQLERRGLVISTRARPVLVYGAGEAGRQLVRSMLSSPDSDLRPVGLLDDDPWKRHLRIHGVAVLGGRTAIAAAASLTGAETVVIAIPTATPGLIREVRDVAREAGLAVKVLPRVSELLGHRATVRDVRDIDVHDLLGRGAVQTDLASIAGYVTGRRVLVTGAGGSIGSELCRQLHTYGPAELIMLDRDESALHEVELSIHGRALLDSPRVVLCDIRDRSALHEIFRSRQPEVVFHAAALKHLPMLEQYPSEAMKTNVLGTANVLQAASMVGVERFVNVSTDKAADPTSVLGYSKRAAERLTAAVAAEAAGCYLSVRFGNVLGSRGSVLRTFAAQIAAGGPLTVTHPEVTRYFMTVQEAVQLVIQAAAIGSDGEVLILDMGEPVRILDVAKQLADQSESEIDIVFTGLRPGEKLHEHLYGDCETGDRPVHPLVSHVSVPALRVSRVRQMPLEVTPDEMIRQLAEICELEGGQFVEERESMPRLWSGIEVRPG